MNLVLRFRRIKGLQYSRKDIKTNLRFDSWAVQANLSADEGAAIMCLLPATCNH